ncbi:hypothetical protein HEMROJRC1_17810 [Rodentibacter sp. JRC1]|nr:hypothetical protein HEMROJRC1_17810 [Rodentibacter sp. JRC1]
MLYNIQALYDKTNHKIQAKENPQKAGLSSKYIMLGAWQRLRLTEFAIHRLDTFPK